MPPAKVGDDAVTWANARAKVGFFEAELVDRLPEDTKERRYVTVGNTFLKSGEKPFELPEQGTWHYNRRKAILEAHPEIRGLFGADPRSAALIVVIAAFHTAVGIYASSLPWWAWIALVYSVGALNSFQLCMLAHDAAHGLVFPNRSVFNKVFCVFAFLFVFPGPFGAYWLVEHMWHHNIVVDKIVRIGDPRNPLLRKVLIAFFAALVGQVLFFGISVALLFRVIVHHAKFVAGKEKTALPTEFNVRPYSIFPQIINGWTILNIVCVFALHGFLIRHYGVWPTLYMYASAWISNGLHPLGMRLVQEHYLISKNQPTYSVYSPFSWLCINVGLHVEHHDFATVPWTRLPQITAIAPEFYNSLASYSSYTSVMQRYLFDKACDPQLMLSENPTNH